MTLTVHAWGAYATFDPKLTPWRPADYDTNKVVKALKRWEVNGYATVQDAAGVWRRVERGSEQVADNLLGLWGACKLREMGFVGVYLVPVPSSSMTDPKADCAAGRLAAAIKSDALRKFGSLNWVDQRLAFRLPMQPASRGGTREKDEIKANLVCPPDRLSGRRVVLVDDVLTRGGHLLACAEVLRERGATVEVALVAGRTTMDPIDNPFRVPPESLEF